ncbi:hypothetical protein HAX54_024570, partial [Datura stramonium]|nr:hypothetical protein [Datura stramonium]
MKTREVDKIMKRVPAAIENTSSEESDDEQNTRDQSFLYLDVSNDEEILALMVNTDFEDDEEEQSE